ncbi:MAG: hypothetical protein WC919_04035 [Candidatus Paceibacterota bacterium]
MASLWLAYCHTLIAVSQVNLSGSAGMRYSVEHIGPYGNVIGYFFYLDDAQKVCALFGDDYRVWDNKEHRWV